MAVIAPNSEIYLIKCPLELDNENQLSFANATAQHNYFNGLPKLSLTNATFQRKDGTIRWPGSMEDILEYNYCMYRNKSHGNKWFYAFIEEMTYVSDNMTSIKISTDVWQTWQFDITWKASFVEREHVVDDTFGAHTLEEGIPTGEYIVNAFDEYGVTNPTSFGIIMQVSDLPAEIWRSSMANRERVYGGLPSGCIELLFSFSDVQTLYLNLTEAIKWFDDLGKGEAIVAMYVVPKSVFNNPQGVAFESDDQKHAFECYIIPPTNSAYRIGTHNWTRNSTLDTYSPHNNKVLCYPYNYLMISNNGGSDIVYRWEDFSSSNASFTLDMIINQGCDMKLRPSNYKRTNLSGGYAYAMTGQKLPVLSWNSDYYLNWQAKNGMNAVVTSAEQFRRDLNTEDPEGWASYFGKLIGGTFDFVASGFRTITNSLSGANRDAKLTPDEEKGNSNTGDINFTLGKTCFSGYKMSVRRETAIMIDQYFDRYGYKVNINKIPALSSRTNWNYVKTVGCNIIGDIPQGDMQQIKSMFNNGVTIWHNASTYLDYSQSNNII